MAKGGTIEIEVELQGAQDIKEGLGSIGKAGKSLAQGMAATNTKLGEGLEGVGESVFGVLDSFSELKHGISTVSQTGVRGFTALLGPIGMVVTAGFALYETFKQISGAALEAEENTQAMSAAAADLQSKLEALSEKGVKLARQEIEKFSKANLRAQMFKEKLEKAQEKLTKTFVGAYEAEERLRVLREKLAKATDMPTYRRLTQDVTDATNDLNEARKKEQKEIAKLLPLQEATNKHIRETEALYISFEERSPEFLKNKIKENIERLKSLKIIEHENKLNEKAAQLAKAEIERRAKLALIMVEENAKNQEALEKQNKAIADEIKAIDQRDLVNRQSARQKEKIEKEAEAKRKERAKRAMDLARQRRDREKAEQEKRKQEALKVFAEESRIKQLEIQAQEDSTQKQINLATHRYVTQLQLAKDNLNQQRIAILEFNAELKGIRDKEAKEALQAEQARVKQAQAFSMDAAIFNAQQIENNLERELELLRLSYEQKVMLAEGSELEINELTRRYAIDRQKLLASQASNMKETFTDMFASLGRGMASAAYNAIFFSGSLKEATANIIKGLGEQAAVESLMQTAKGFAALSNPFTAAFAPGFFKSAGIFAGAAALAGVTASAMGAGDTGGGGGLGGGASAMGSPQTAQAPQREEATSSSMVFNINFSGAVVYDTRKAAEMALADRVTRAMNTQRRGAPRSRRS
jgi:hypothetical protein